MTFISPADAELPAAAARMMAIETKATHHTILHCALCIVQAVICVRVGGLWLSASVILEPFVLLPRQWTGLKYKPLRGREASHVRQAVCLIKSKAYKDSCVEFQLSRHYFYGHIFCLHTAPRVKNNLRIYLVSPR